jgi:hypothetical protein
MMNRLPLLIAGGCAAGFCGGAIGAVAGHTWWLMRELGGFSVVRSSKEKQVALKKAMTEMNHEERNFFLQQGRLANAVGGAVGGLLVVFHEDQFVPRLTLRNVARNISSGFLAGTGFG